MHIRSLKIGILDILSQNPGRSEGESLHETVDMARLADALGFERFWMAEHHNAGIASACPEVLTAAVLAQTHRIRVGPAGVLLRFYSPFKVADTFRTLEALFPDRVDLGIGRGGADPATTTALLDGAPQAASAYERKVCELSVYLRNALPATHPLAKAYLTPQHIPTHPRMWVLGCGRGSVPLAAQLSASYSFARFLPFRDDPRAVLDEYRASFVPTPYAPRPTCNVAVAGVCASSNAKARKILDRHKNEFFRPEVVGDPDTCRDQLLAIAEAHGTDDIVFLHVAPDAAERAEGYRLLAQALSLRVPA